jgi:hypothetical protein
MSRIFVCRCLARLREDTKMRAIRPFSLALWKMHCKERVAVLLAV